ncbi:MAG: hypothetical protein WBG92_06745 [Thiohalocapsa sp.]
MLIRPMTAPERGLVLAWGRKYALFNLKTLVRGKLYDLDQTEIRENLYDLSENFSSSSHEELFRAELVPSMKLLHRDRLLELANLETFEQVLEALPAPLGEFLAGSTSLIDVQRRIGAYQSEVARRTLASGRSGVARALA